MTTQYRNEGWLKYHFLEKGLSTNRIAAMCNVHPSTILRWLKRFGIPMRSRSQAMKKVKRDERLQRLSKDVDIAGFLFNPNQIISDGELKQRAEQSHRRSHAEARKKHWEQVARRLKKERKPEAEIDYTVEDQMRNIQEIMDTPLRKRNKVYKATDREREYLEQ